MRRSRRSISGTGRTGERDDEQPRRHHGGHSRPSAEARAAGALDPFVRRRRAQQSSRGVRRATGADGRSAAAPNAADPLAPVRDKISGAKVVCSQAREIAGNESITPGMKPADLADVDYGVVRASFGVAETGSVCLTDADLGVNTLGYLPQHLIVLLDPADIVINMHHAYRRPEWRQRALRRVPHRPLGDCRHRRRPDSRRTRSAFAVGAPASEALADVRWL